MLSSGTVFVLVVSILVRSTVSAETTNVTSQSRGARALSLFEIVKFKNEACTPGGSAGRVGTCYTNDECSRRGGAASGTCANGFGVCCIISLSCGGTSSDNCTYLSENISPNGVSSCSYEICKKSSDICRIRLDFLQHTIAGPVVGTTDSSIELSGNAIGDCITDTFTVKNPRAKSPPVICGFNNGQHMIYEMASPCSSLDFQLGAGGQARNWDIKVTQYKCGNEDIAGQDGCLQYFTTPTGTIASYNFPTTSTTIDENTTHLSRQSYSICVRRHAGMCSICYTPSIIPDAEAADDQVSFGLNKGMDAGVDTECRDDYLQIPYGELDKAVGEIGKQLFCGRAFNVDAAATVPVSICSSNIPFQIHYVTTQNEVDKGKNNEMINVPGGIVGFSLDYRQVPC